MINKANIEKTNAWPFIEARKILKERKKYIEQKGKIIVNIPANRLGNVEDISNGCIYLASDEASFITGTTLHINGGMSMI